MTLKEIAKKYNLVAIYTFGSKGREAALMIRDPMKAV